MKPEEYKVLFKVYQHLIDLKVPVITRHPFILDQVLTDRDIKLTKGLFSHGFLSTRGTETFFTIGGQDMIKKQENLKIR